MMKGNSTSGPSALIQLVPLIAACLGMCCGGKARETGEWSAEVPSFCREVVVMSPGTPAEGVELAWLTELRLSEQRGDRARSARLYRCLGAMYTRQDRPTEALPAFVRSRDLAPHGSREWARATEEVAGLLEAMGDLDGATAEWRALVDAHTGSTDLQKLRRAESLAKLSAHLRRRGKARDAVLVAEEGAALLAGAGRAAPVQAWLARESQEAHEALGDHRGAALDCERRAGLIMGSNLGGPVELPELLEQCAVHFEAAGQPDEASAIRARAIEIESQPSTGSGRNGFFAFPDK